MTANNKTARIAGILYLIIIAAGIFAEFFVRQSLIVAGDAATTASNIMAAESLFRFGIAGDLIMIISDIALALAFYFLLKPVSRSLSMMAAFFRMTQATILGFNLLNLLLALSLVSGVSYLAVVGTDQLQALGLLFLEAHSIGYSVGLVFFGINCLVLGYLVFKSGYLPKVLGILLVFAGVGYLVDCFAQFLLPTYDLYADTFAMVVFGPAIIGELSMALWLLIKGVNVSASDQRVTLKATPAEGISA
jgi:hypothetical protein